MLTMLRLELLQLQRHLAGTNLYTVLKLMPYVLLVLGLKVYAVMLLLSSGLVLQQQQPAATNQQLVQLQDIPRKQLEQKLTTTEEPGWREKQAVLAALDTTAITATASNRTPDTSWLFFNRIPRSGGKTLVALLQALGSDLDYQHQEHAYRTPWQRLMSDEEQKNLATWFEYNFWPKTYDRLALYINFTHFRSPYVSQKPASITLLRDPVQQFVSQFHHRRTNQDTVRQIMAAKERDSPGAGRRWYWRDLESCILEQDPECALEQGVVDFERSVPFLCGQHQRCLKAGEHWGLQRAKYMAEYEYSVVGVLEQWNSTMAVLEYYLPAFFQGARQRYWSQVFEEDRHVNKNPRRVKPLSERALRVLRSKLSAEYELYEFCKQRLALQLSRVALLLEHTSPLPAVKGPKKSLSAWDRFQIEMKY